ncbi:MAG: aminotransferase class V-fold PLP-dependent enzyme [Caldilineaceae bacterium]
MSPHLPDFDAVRADFPRTEEKLWLAAAETHPYSVHTLRALERYTDYRVLGPGTNRHSFTAEMHQETKALFAGLIGAKPAEIAFVQSTTDGENVILAGLGLSQPGVKRAGNIVIDDLHFEASKYIYTRLAQSGSIELRIIPHRQWQINFADVEAAIDEHTRLVSLALVSQVNGYMADIQAISRLAHAHGAYVYCDMIQGAGCALIDVTRMGIDFAACATYKWLMGDFGIGFLYVREVLHETVEPTRFGLSQVQSHDDYDFVLYNDSRRYEASRVSFLSGICAYEGVKYISALGVEKIRAHAKPLTDHLQKELPGLGYQPITPLDAPTPIVSFLPANIEETQTKLERAFGHQVVSFREWYQTNERGEREMVRGMRLGISVYNNQDDIDQFLNALD